MIKHREVPEKSQTLTSNSLVGLQSDVRRREDLKRLLPVWPNQAENLTLDGRRHIVRCLERALRAERRRGCSGHWAYNISRHAALVSIYKQERAALIAFQIATSAKKAKSPPPMGGPL